ncbi:Uncharacterised protein [Bordetella ansorpii]|uniref:Uncharacterized protein n=1 Tax=Bordetella ansorpii TaxID=288768 RepID=A0A157Q3V1_9BORD|nr:hypothetical protein [Bordetella ansorpii]SAI39769.1 Uncharacterised protein [Bordetella ansorpii]
MTLHELENLPLAISVARHPRTAGERAGAWMPATQWPTGGERLAVLHVLAGGDQAIGEPEDALRDIKTWLQAYAVQAGRQILCIAIVAPPAHVDRMMGADAEHLLGMPAEVFADVPSALAFMGWFIAPAEDAAWDAAAIQTRVQQALRDNPGLSALPMPPRAARRPSLIR